MIQPNFNKVIAQPTDESFRDRLLSLLLVIAFTSCIGVTYGFGIYLLPAVVIDMQRDLGFSYRAIGIVTGIAQLGFLVAALISGWLSSRFGAGRVVLLSVLCSSLGLLMLGNAQNIIQIGIICMVLGACTASVWTPMVGIVGRFIKFDNRGKTLGLIASGTNYGVFLNGLIVPMIIGNQGWRGLWFLVGLIGLIITLLSAVLMHKSNLLHFSSTKSDHPAHQKIPHQHAAQRSNFQNFDATAPLEHSQAEQSGVLSWKSILQTRPYLIWFIMFLSGFACMPFFNYLSLYLQDDLAYSLAFASRIWMIIGMLGMIGGVLVGWLADRMGVRFTLIVMYMTVMFAAAMLVWNKHLVLVYFAAIGFGIAFNGIFGMIPAYISKIYSPEIATGVFSGANVMLGIGSMSGNLASGFSKSIYGSFSLVYIFITVTAALLIACCIGLTNERISS